VKKLLIIAKEEIKMELKHIQEDLKALSSRNDINLSLKFGFLGLGMGGCNIAAECADITTNVENNRFPYSALLVNTNLQDFKKINTKNPNIKKITLKGFDKGAGRDIQVGEKAFEENLDSIEEEVKTMFRDREFIWIVCGLGGGTGTGAILKAIQLLYSSGFQEKIGLILTLPRDKEGITVISNALNRIQKIYKAMENLGSIILVDNQKLYNQFISEHPEKKIEDYIQFSNRFIANTLHGINVVTSSFEPYGETHFDASELYNMVKTPGILSLSKLSLPAASIDLGQPASFLTKFENSIQKGILSDGYNYGKADRAAVSVIANKNTADRIFQIAFVNSIEEKIDELSPIAGEKPIATYIDNKTNQVEFFSLFAGLGLPKRIKALIDENNRLLQLAEDEEQSEIENALASFTITNKKRSKKEVTNLFEEDDTEDTEDLFPKASKKKNPLSLFED
jgi:cell division GTPase FtsZ